MVFSDLDGALVDEKTFEWTAARAAIARLQQAGIPLVFISGKTREEIATLRAQIGHHDAFAAEHGGVVVRPGQKDLVLGRSAGALERAAEELAEETGAELELLSRMSRRRAMQTTGLPDSKIGPARRRSYSAPFLLVDGSVHTLNRAARARSLRIIPGKRLWQLVGDHDKGDAVAAIRKDHPDTLLIGIGDKADDLPLLRAVDLPIFQGRRRPPGLPENAHLDPRGGPIGWSRAVWTKIPQHARVRAPMTLGVH